MLLACGRRRDGEREIAGLAGFVGVAEFRLAVERVHEQHPVAPVGVRSQVERWPAEVERAALWGAGAALRGELQQQSTQAHSHAGQHDQLSRLAKGTCDPGPSSGPGW